MQNFYRDGPGIKVKGLHINFDVKISDVVGLIMKINEGICEQRINKQVYSVSYYTLCTPCVLDYLIFEEKNAS